MRTGPVLLLGALLSRAGGAWAQEPALPAYPRTETTYLDAGWKSQTTAAGAFRRVEKTYLDSLRGTQRLYYPNGKLAESGEYEDLRRNIRDGLSEDWYQNGQLRVREHWSHGHRTGELLTYYPNGVLKRREANVYNKSTGSPDSTGAECFGPSGRRVAYYAYESMPVPPVGNARFVEFIQREISYPQAALREQAQGKVYVSFTVDTTGQLTAVHLVKGVHPLLDAEALRVVQSAPPWTPGSQDGRPVRVSYTVPIGFAVGRNNLKRVMRVR